MKTNALRLFDTAGMPLIAFSLFLTAWSVVAGSVETSIGRLPGPIAVAHEARDLFSAHTEERR